jgi:hypothetical protein
LTVAEQKRRWFEARRSELHKRGLKDTDIAKQLRIGRSYFSQVVKSDTVGDTFIDSMCQSFGFKYTITADVHDTVNKADGAEQATPEQETRFIQMFERLLVQNESLTRHLVTALDRIDELRGDVKALRDAQHVPK